MRKLVILSGVSGSGKSTYSAALKSNHPDWTVCSTDNLFVVNGKYCFDASKLKYYHQLNKEICEAFMMVGRNVILDNTNTQWWEIEPYIKLAMRYGYTTEIIRVIAPLLDCVKRNVHNVNEIIIKKQYDRLESLESLVNRASRFVQCRGNMRKILVSRGFGAGWSSWNSGEVAKYMLEYKPIIDYLEAGNEPKSLPKSGLLEQLERDCKEKFDEDYVCILGYYGLYVAHVNGRVRINEYDGAESYEEEGSYEGWL